MKANNVSYQTKSGFLFKNLSLDTDLHNFILIEGPNGSGKSTLLKILLGIIPSSTGNIDLGGQVSFVPDSSERYFIGLSPKLLFEFLKKQFGIAPDIFNSRLYTLINKFDIQEKHMEQTIQSLSLGEKKKVMIIAAFLLDSEVYIMDEPLSGLDQKSVENLVFLIKDYLVRGKKFIIVSHEQQNLLPQPDFVISLKG